MIKGVESITLFTENAKRLADFYKDKVGLKMTLEAEVGEKGENLFGFEFGRGPGLYIMVMDHSKVKGENKGPERIIFNLEVDNIEEDVERLDRVGVRKIQDT